MVGSNDQCSQLKLVGRRKALGSCRTFGFAPGWSVGMWTKGTPSGPGYPRTSTSCSPAPVGLPSKIVDSLTIASNDCSIKVTFHSPVVATCVPNAPNISSSVPRRKFQWSGTQPATVDQPEGWGQVHSVVNDIHYSTFEQQARRASVQALISGGGRVMVYAQVSGKGPPRLPPPGPMTSHSSVGLPTTSGVENIVFQYTTATQLALLTSSLYLQPSLSVLKY